MRFREVPVDVRRKLEEKRNLLTEFLATTGSFQRALDLQKTSELQGLLDGRQDLIRRITEIDNEIRQQNRDNLPTAGKLPVEEADAVRKLWKEISQLLCEADAVDQACAERIHLRLGEIKADLARIKEGVKAAHCYAAASTAPPRFVDMTK